MNSEPPRGLGVLPGMLECPRREGHRKPGCDGPVPMALSGVSSVPLFRWPVFCHAHCSGLSHRVPTCPVRAVTCPLCHVTTRGWTPLSAVRVLGQLLFLLRPHVTTTPWAPNLGSVGLRFLRDAGPTTPATPVSCRAGGLSPWQEPSPPPRGQLRALTVTFPRKCHRVPGS